MKNYIVILFALCSLNAFSSTVEEQAKKAISCFDEVSVQISIGLSQAHHAAKPYSAEEAETRKELENFNDYIEGALGIPTGCFESTETEVEKFECIRDTYSSITFNMAHKYDVIEVVTASCL